MIITSLSHNCQRISASFMYIDRVFQGLEEQGLRLTHYEPNFLKPALVELEGHTFSVFAEQVWVNVQLKKALKQQYKVPDENDFDYLEMA